MHSEEAKKALKRLLDDAFELSSPRTADGCGVIRNVRPSAAIKDAANEPSYCQHDANQGRCDYYRVKNGANLLKIAPFLIAFFHFFVSDPIQCLAAWLLAFWPFLSSLLPESK